MRQETHRRAKEIFLAARGQPREARSAFVEEVCGDDSELRREVGSLLDFLDEIGGSLETASPLAPSLTPSQEIGNYRIRRKLGEGGMGEVYEAEQQGPLRRTVALKLIKWGLNSARVVARFESERQALALMNHPTIAQVFEAGTMETGRPYFAMELVPGLPITEHCDRHRLDARQRLELFLALCEGVQHAHDVGIIHRDIKPGNVLVMEQDGASVPKLIDFGIAKATALRLTERTLYTELGEWIGTPEYMSPEQATLGQVDVDARTDVYSLGVLLYELLAGAQPFDAESLRQSGFDEMRRKIQEDDLPRPGSRFEGLGEACAAVASHRNTEVSALLRLLRGDLDRIAMKALEKEPPNRYASVADFAADVERFLRGEPILARPPSVAYRLAKIIRQNRRSLVAAVLTISALFVGITATTLWLRRPSLPTIETETGGTTASLGPSIAVLPFVNLSADPDNEYFSDGLSEELLNALARIPELRVAARTSAFAYKGKDEDVRTIGETLAVGTILEGSVRRSGSSLRITAQLIDVEDGFHLWSNVFEREVGDVFAIQDEIALAVADALKVELLQRDSPDHAAETIEAYDLYLQGRQRLRERSPGVLSEAIELFRQALVLDPAYAPAHTGLAEGLLLLARRGDLPMEVAERQAGAGLKQALELDGQLAEAHAVLGRFRSTIGDLDGAESALRRAIQLNASLSSAHLWLGRVLAERNRAAEADAAFQRALTLDPLNLTAHHAVARALMNRGQYEEAMLRFQRWLRIDPDSAETYRVMALYARTYGRLDNAVGWARRAIELDPQGPLNQHELVMAYSALGEHELAEGWMDRAYRLAPNNHWTFTLRAFTYIEAGEFALLEEFTQRLLTLDPPPDAGPLPQVARVRLALAGLSKVYQEDYASAVELYERAMEEPFTGILELGIDADAFAFLALAYRQLGREKEADAAMEKCLELIRSRQDWIWGHLIMPETLAGIYTLQGREDEAVETLRTAFNDGWFMVSVLRSSPHFEDLRARADYQQLLDQAAVRLEEMRERVRRTEDPVG